MSDLKTATTEPKDATAGENAIKREQRTVALEPATGVASKEVTTHKDNGDEKIEESQSGPPSMAVTTSLGGGITRWADEYDEDEDEDIREEQEAAPSVVSGHTVDSDTRFTPTRPQSSYARRDEKKDLHNIWDPRRIGSGGGGGNVKRELWGIGRQDSRSSGRWSGNAQVSRDIGSRHFRGAHPDNAHCSSPSVKEDFSAPAREVSSRESLSLKDRPKLVLNKILGELSHDSDARNPAIFGSGRPREEKTQHEQQQPVPEGDNHEEQTKIEPIAQPLEHSIERQLSKAPKSKQKKIDPFGGAKPQDIFAVNLRKEQELRERGELEKPRASPTSELQVQSRQGSGDGATVAVARPVFQKKPEEGSEGFSEPLGHGDFRRNQSESSNRRGSVSSYGSGVVNRSSRGGSVSGYNEGVSPKPTSGRQSQQSIITPPLPRASPASLHDQDVHYEVSSIRRQSVRPSSPCIRPSGPSPPQYSGTVQAPPPMGGASVLRPFNMFHSQSAMTFPPPLMGQTIVSNVSHHPTLSQPQTPAQSSQVSQTRMPSTNLRDQSTQIPQRAAHHQGGPPPMQQSSRPPSHVTPLTTMELHHRIELYPSPLMPTYPMEHSTMMYSPLPAEMLRHRPHGSLNVKSYPAVVQQPPMETSRHTQQPAYRPPYPPTQSSTLPPERLSSTESRPHMQQMDEPTAVEPRRPTQILKNPDLARSSHAQQQLNGTLCTQRKDSSTLITTSSLPSGVPTNNNTTAPASSRRKLRVENKPMQLNSSETSLPISQTQSQQQTSQPPVQTSSPRETPDLKQTAKQQELPPSESITEMPRSSSTSLISAQEPPIQPQNHYQQYVQPGQRTMEFQRSGQSRRGGYNYPYDQRNSYHPTRQRGNYSRYDSRGGRGNGGRTQGHHGASKADDQVEHKSTSIQDGTTSLSQDEPSEKNESINQEATTQDDDRQQTKTPFNKSFNQHGVLHRRHPQTNYLQRKYSQQSEQQQITSAAGPPVPPPPPPHDGSPHHSGGYSQRGGSQDNKPSTRSNTGRQQHSKTKRNGHTSPRSSGVLRPQTSKGCGRYGSETLNENGRKKEKPDRELIIPIRTAPPPALPVVKTQNRFAALDNSDDDEFTS